MPVHNTGASSATVLRLETAASTEGSLAATATSAQVVGLENNRTALYVTNVGSEWVTVNHKTPVVYGSGIMLSPNGGSYVIESGNLDKRALHAICATGKTSTLAWYQGTGEEVLQS